LFGAQPTSEFGDPVDPRSFLRVIEVKAVADLLAHSSIAITGDVYGHTSDDTAPSIMPPATTPGQNSTHHNNIDITHFQNLHSLWPP
jgi:hypothetical protein